PPPPPRSWYDEDLDVIATQWKDLLTTGGYDASLYNIQGDRVLCSIAKGWHANEVKKFFLTRPETKSVTWNSVETLAKDFQEL
ncbi:hypothetical protein TeGR_g12685, partial [Tetraparma gracilis]